MLSNSHTVEFLSMSIVEPRSGSLTTKDFMVEIEHRIIWNFFPLDFESHSTMLEGSSRRSVIIVIKFLAFTKKASPEWMVEKESITSIYIKSRKDGENTWKLRRCILGLQNKCVCTHARSHCSGTPLVPFGRLWQNM